LEDDEAAQHALYGEEVELRNTRDVLNDHRARNRPNKSPNQQQLLNAAKHQLQRTRNTDLSDADNEDEEAGARRTHTHRHKPAEDAARRQLQHTDNTDLSDADNEDEEAGTHRTHARRHKPAEANPKTAGHYPECWREAIDRAKEQFRRFIMLYNLFPGRDAHLQDAARILSKVIADERSEGKPFNPSKHLVFIINDSNSSLCPQILSKTVI
jgi:hypothetical protein